MIAGLVLLGMGNGMATLARATVIADRYGAAAYGTIASVAASATIGRSRRRPGRGRGVRGGRRLQRLLVTLAAIALAAAALAYAAERPSAARTG